MIYFIISDPVSVIASPRSVVVSTPIFCSLCEMLAILQLAFLEEIEKTVALLFFEDVRNCPYVELLDVSQRLKTASEVNAVILTSQSTKKDQ